MTKILLCVEIVPAASADVNKDSVRIVSRDALDMHALRRLLFFFILLLLKSIWSNP